jgi:hypothetical protein
MPTHKLLVVFAFSFIATSVAISGSGQTGESRNTPALKAAAEGQPDQAGLGTRAGTSEGVTKHQAATDRPRVTVIDGRLSVSAMKKSMKALLEEISQRSGVYVSTDEVKDSLVSIELKDVSLEAGLQEILNNQDAFFLYGAREDNPENQQHRSTSLRAVWVYPKGQGRRILPVGPEKWASSEELRSLAADPDPEVRARAFETLVGRSGSKAQDVVFEALEDSNDRVRFRTLQAALNNRVALSPDSLQYLVQNDLSPVVRFLALSGMAENSEAGSNKVRVLAESALNDPNPQVREQAREILDQLNPSEQTQETSQSQDSPQ